LLFASCGDVSARLAGGVCRFLFPRQVIPYPLGNVCQGLLPKGECHHWQIFFPLKEVFPAVSPLSPMSGWQPCIQLINFVSLFFDAVQ